MAKEIKTSINLIPAYQYHAVKRRYEGASALKISEEMREKYGVNYPDSTIRWWFCRTGTLAKFYREYADEMIEMEKEEARDYIKGNVAKSAKILAAIMISPTAQDSTKVAAAKEFLERGLGKEELPINANIKAQVSVVDMLIFLEQLDDDANIPTVAERTALDKGAQ